MRVLHLLSSNQFSGAENMACRIIDIFKILPNIEMAYCSPSGTISMALMERDIQFVSLNKLSVKEFRKACREWKPDIIHAHDYTASVVAAISTTKIPIISYIHSNNVKVQKINIRSLLYLAISTRFSHIFWISESARNGYCFNSLLAKKSSVLPTVIDPKKIIDMVANDKTEYEFDIIFVGRITFQKNPERLIAIIEQVCKQRPNTKVAIIGRGDLYDKIFNQIELNNLSENILMLGFQSNPFKMMRNSKVMFMTSRFEGYPAVAIEAMALGVPIVSTPTDGMCDIVIEGITGFLSDKDEVLVNKLVEIIGNNELRKCLSKASSTRFNEINDIDYYRNTLLKVYKKNMKS